MTFGEAVIDRHFRIGTKMYDLRIQREHSKLKPFIATLVLIGWAYLLWEMI